MMTTRLPLIAGLIALLPGCPARAAAHGIVNLSKNYYYVIAHGSDEVAPLTDRYAEARASMHLAPQGMAHDRDAFHLGRLKYFEVGIAENLRDEVGRDWRVVFVTAIDGVKATPLDGNWNFQLDGSPPRLNTLRDWCPECAKVGPLSKDPRRQ
jgi:hypothetical protein